MLFVSKKLKKNKNPLSSDFKEFFDAMHEMEYPWWVLAPLGEELESYVKQKLFEKRFDENSLQEFFQEKKPTPLAKQNREAMQLRKELDETQLLSQIKELDAQATMALIKQKDEVLYKKIKRHLRKYAFFGMMHFWGEPFSEEKLFSQINSLKESAEEKQDIVFGKKLSWVKKQAEKTTFWRQFVAETCAIASFYALKKFKKAARKMNLKYDQVLWLTPIEFGEAVDGKTVVDKNILEQRSKACGLIVENNEITLLVGEKLDLLLKQFFDESSTETSLTGVVANKGLVQGIARIVLTPKDVINVRKGEVLVSPETTPDFMSAISNACAIVTDIGGIGSHAAIVAREFGIPCIVGTKNATRVIKDGDLIEVNANNGLVKIITRK